MKKIRDFFSNLSLSEKWNFVFLVVLFIISISSVIFTSLFNIENKWAIQLILLLITNICLANIWERYGILDKIDKKVQTVLNRNSLNKRKIIESEYTLENMWYQAEKVSIAAMACSALFTTKREIFENSINAGTQFELIIMDPNSTSTFEHYKNKIKDGFNVNRQVSSLSLEAIKNFNNHSSSQVKYWLTEINLPYAIMIVEKNIPEKSFIKIDLYSIDVFDGERPSFLIYRHDIEMYNFFIDQYQIIKNKSRIEQPKI